MEPLGRARLASNLAGIRARMAAACARAGRAAEDVHLVAVTKTVGVETIRALYDLGQRDFGESRPQRIWELKPSLPGDARWHLIGPLQTNKVRRTLPLAALLHSLDRRSLVDAIAAETALTGRVVAATIEVNLTGEPSKAGFAAAELRDYYPELLRVGGIQCAGMMTMARMDDPPDACRATFRELRTLRDELRESAPAGPALEILSMGMSGDFEIAIEEGATHVRIGTALFADD